MSSLPGRKAQAWGEKAGLRPEGGAAEELLPELGEEVKCLPRSASPLPQLLAGRTPRLIPKPAVL